MTQKVTSPETSETDATPEPIKLTPTTARKIEAVRVAFVAFTNGFTLLAGKREELAPKFMRAFEAFVAARPENPPTFVDFVRVLEPTVPADRTGYKNNRAYQAADYLRRLDASLRAQKTEPADPAHAPAKPIDAVARLLASLLPIIPDDQHGKIWDALQSELHWSEPTVRKVQKVVNNVLPLLRTSTPRGVSMPAVKVRIVHASATESTDTQLAAVNG